MTHESHGRSNRTVFPYELCIRVSCLAECGAVSQLRHDAGEPALRHWPGDDYGGGRYPSFRQQVFAEITVLNLVGGPFPTWRLWCKNVVCENRQLARKQGTSRGIYVGSMGLGVQWDPVIWE